ncbi:hypothetical protein ES705_48105 [subsurface metagenome]
MMLNGILILFLFQKNIYKDIIETLIKLIDIIKILLLLLQVKAISMNGKELKKGGDLKKKKCRN